MAKKFLYIFITIIFVCSLLFVGLSMNSANYNFSLNSTGTIPAQIKFRYISCHDAGEYVSYTFHSSDERIFKTYNDCIGCEPYEVGDTSFWRQFMSKKHAEETFNGNDDNDSAWRIVKGSRSENKGVKRKIVELLDEDGKVLIVRILWIEPTERTYAYWFIEAPHVEIAKEFEKGAIFQKYKKSIPPEPPTCDTYGSNSANYDWCQ